MVDLQLGGLFDFQSVPANAGVAAMTCNLMASHLANSENLKVWVIETLNPFQWDLLRQHPQYDANWDTQISICTLLSMVEIFWFFTFGPGISMEDKSTLLFITNFHEIVELYSLHVALAYEEALLKHQIDTNREVLANLDRVKEEGLDLISLPQLPPQSDLLRVSPYIKAQKHIDELFKELSEFTYKHSNIIVLLGHLDAKFEPYANPRPPSMSPDTSYVGSQPNTTLSQGGERDSSRLVLTPVTFGKKSSGNKATGEAGLNDHKISARLVFYNDWYHKSPYIRSMESTPSDSEDFLVLVVKVTTLNGVGNINEPVFFDLSARHPNSDAPLNGWLVDLQVQEDQNLSTFIQNSINSTQAPRAVSTQITRELIIPSSPLSTERKSLSQVLQEEMEEKEDKNSEDEGSEILQRRSEEKRNDYQGNEIHGNEIQGNENQGNDNQENEEQENKVQHDKQHDSHSVSSHPENDEFPELYIEGSDVELTGTLLEDWEEL